MQFYNQIRDVEHQEENTIDKKEAVKFEFNQSFSNFCLLFPASTLDVSSRFAFDLNSIGVCMSAMLVLFLMSFHRGDETRLLL